MSCTEDMNERRKFPNRSQRLSFLQDSMPNGGRTKMLEGLTNNFTPKIFFFLCGVVSVGSGREVFPVLRKLLKHQERGISLKKKKKREYEKILDKNQSGPFGAWEQEKNNVKSPPNNH